MLDAFIIEKIQRETDLRDSGREPLHIEINREPMREVKDRRQEEDTNKRGIAIIDFNI